MGLIGCMGCCTIPATFYLNKNFGSATDESKQEGIPEAEGGKVAPLKLGDTRTRNNRYKPVPDVHGSQTPNLPTPGDPDYPAVAWDPNVPMPTPAGAIKENAKP